MNNMEYLIKICKNIKRSICIPALVFSLCTSCDMTDYNMSLIVGEWEAVSEGNMTAYVFESNEICRNETGFFEYIDSTKATVSNPAFSIENKSIDMSMVLNNIVSYYRSHSCYKIEGNCLKIYNPALKTWEKQYIDFESPDILILSDRKKTKQEYYARRKTTNKDNEPLFDKILVYYPSTIFLSARFYSYSKDGQLIVYGNGGILGNCTFATIKEEDYLQLDNYFRMGNLEKYLTQISRRGLKTFSPNSPSIIFVRGNEMYSFSNDFNILDSSDYKDIYRAYIISLFYIDNLLHYFPNEISYDDKMKLLEIDDMRSWELYYGEKEVKLMDLECYYLASLLRFAPNTEESFNPTYLIKDKETKEVKIETDGRHFIYQVSTGKKIVDIGFNFIEENGFDKDDVVR